MAIKQSINDKENDPANVGIRYSVSNPHPEFGVNSNIINESGHTVYPKWVDHPTEKDVVQISQSVGKDQFINHKVENKFPKRVLVQNEAEEKALLGGSKKGWDKDK